MILIMTALMMLVEEVSAAVASQVESTAGGSGGKSIITVCADRSSTSSSSVMTGCLGWTKLPNRVWGGHHRAIVALMVEEEEVPPTADDAEAEAEVEEEESDEAVGAAAGSSITASEEDAEILPVTATSVKQYEDLPSSEDDDDENNNKATMNTDWEYKDGLLIASGYNDDATDDDRTQPQCLGLDTYANYGRQYLTEKSCKSYYPVKLQDCPPASSSNAAAGDDAIIDDAMSRHLRFLMTENGQLQSLIPVLDSNAEDVMMTHPYCLTILAEVDQEADAKDTDTNSSRCKMTGAYLMPCVTTTKEEFAARTEGRDDAESAEVEDPSMLTVRSQFFGGVFQMNYHREQYFTVAGTSEPFLLALQRDWGYNDVVELVYHFGLESSSGSSLPPVPPFSSLEAASSDSSSPLTQLSQTFAEQVAPEDDNEDYSILIRTNSPTAEEHDLVLIETPGKTSHGFIDFVPSDYRVSGPMTAALQGTTTIATVSTTAFEVEPYKRHVNCPRHSSSSLSLMSSNTKIFVGVMCGVIVASIIIMLIVKTVCIDVDDDNKDYVVDNNDDDATTGKDTVNTDDHSTASSSPSSLDEESLGALDEKA